MNFCRYLFINSDRYILIVIVIAFLAAAVATPRGTGELYSRASPSVSPRLYLMNRLFEKVNLLALVVTSIKFESAFPHA